jgi:F0F1-type ATP synthase epsilon subunit
MKLHIVTPGSKETFGIMWIEVNTNIGNRIIQSGHVPTILLLGPQTTCIFCLNSGKREELYIPIEAIAEVTRTSVTILLNQEL